MEIKYYNRYVNKLEEEKVYGDKGVEWLYASTTGKVTSSLLARPIFSKVYGAIQDTPFSKLKVGPFIENFSINMDDYVAEFPQNDQYPYSSFNQFFIRKFKAGKRKFPTASSSMGAFAEARYFGYEQVAADETIPVKGRDLSPALLVKKERWGELFKDGPLLLARLCPVDYHRYHFCDEGKVIDHYRLPGPLHSVNPIALKSKSNILITNERSVTIVETKNFGKLAYIEVGAICVGKIVQSSEMKDKSFMRGEEKGYFLFGGSTVIVVGEKGKWKPSQDILDNTKNGVETYCRLGDEIAKA